MTEQAGMRIRFADSGFRELGTQVGEMVDRKREAYGSSFAKSGDFLRLLFPDGLPPDRYDDALLQVRIFDKQMRIATDRDAFGESPYVDIAGYGLLGTQLHADKSASVAVADAAGVAARELS